MFITINGNGKNLTFKYNSSGLRTQKVSGSTTTEYVYSGDQLMSQRNGTDTLSFIYDTDGQAIGVSRNGLYYYYMRNVQGDVIALYNCYGDINSRYTYDAWGNLASVTDANGNAITDPIHIANVNPIRYRGYYYDTETGLYYLQSRYYNPQWGRFLNADDMGVLTLSTDDFLITNLFAYCGNNPVNNVDPSGKWVQAVVGALFGAVIGAFTYWLEYKLGIRKWNSWVFAGHIALSAALGAVGAHFRYWAKFSNLAAKMANKLYLIKGVKAFPLIKAVINYGSRGITFAINSISKKITRKPGESMGKFVKRQFGWA